MIVRARRGEARVRGTAARRAAARRRGAAARRTRRARPRRARRRRAPGADVQPLRRRLDDRPDERDQPDARQRRARPVDAPRDRVARLGDDAGVRRRSRPRTSGTFTMKIEPHQKWSSRKPPTTGPERDAEARGRRPDADRPVARSRASVKTLISSDSVAGMMNAAPAPMTARAAISASTPPAKAAAADASAEHREPGEQRAPAPEAVAERAGEQQQPGEHERVGVDHPLQLARCRRRGRAPAWAARR